MMIINYKYSFFLMFQSYVEKFDKIQILCLSLYCGIQNLNFNINDLRDYLLCLVKMCLWFRISICFIVQRGEGGGEGCLQILVFYLCIYFFGCDNWVLQLIVI